MSTEIRIDRHEVIEKPSSGELVETRYGTVGMLHIDNDDNPVFVPMEPDVESGHMKPIFICDPNDLKLFRGKIIIESL